MELASLATELRKRITRLVLSSLGSPDNAASGDPYGLPLPPNGELGLNDGVKPRLPGVRGR